MGKGKGRSIKIVLLLPLTEDALGKHGYRRGSSFLNLATGCSLSPETGGIKRMVAVKLRKTIREQEIGENEDYDASDS